MSCLDIDHVLYQFLSTTGTEATEHEETEMSVNALTEGVGSPPRVRYYIQPPETDIYHISSVLIHVEDNGSWQVQKFGAITDGLTNGISFTLERDREVIVDLTSVHTVKKNGDWAQLMYDVRYDSYGSGDSFLAGSWSFDDAGAPFTLSGRRKESFNCYVADDLSSLITMHVQVQGYKGGQVP